MSKRLIPSLDKVTEIVKKIMEDRKTVETLRELREITVSELRKSNKEYVITPKRLKGVVRSIKKIQIKAKTKRSSKITLIKKCPLCNSLISDTYATNLMGKRVRLGYKCKKCGFKTTSRAIMPMRYTFIWKSSKKITD